VALEQDAGAVTFKVPIAPPSYLGVSIAPRVEVKAELAVNGV